MRVGTSEDMDIETWPLCESRHVGGHLESYGFRCSQPLTGSLILIQMLENGILFACEIQVYGQILGMFVFYF